MEECRYTLPLVHALAHYFNMSGYMSNRCRGLIVFFRTRLSLIEYEYYCIPVYELTGLTCHKTDMIVNAVYISEAIYILLIFMYNHINLILREICLISKIFVAKNTDRIDLIFYCDNCPYNVTVI